MLKKIRKRIIDFLILLLAEDAGTENIARGSALGVFIGLLPIMGIQTILVIPMAVMLRVNKIAAILCIWVTNPITFTFIYSFNYLVGKQIFHSDVHIDKFRYLLKSIVTLELDVIFRYLYDIIIPLVLGSLIVATCAMLVTYFIVKVVFYLYRHKIHHYHSNKNV